MQPNVSVQFEELVHHRLQYKRLISPNQTNWSQFLSELILAEWSTWCQRLEIHSRLVEYEQLWTMVCNKHAILSMNIQAKKQPNINNGSLIMSLLLNCLEHKYLNNWAKSTSVMCSLMSSLWAAINSYLTSISNKWIKYSSSLY